MSNSDIRKKVSGWNDLYEGTIRDQHKGLFLVSHERGKNHYGKFNFLTVFFADRYPNSGYNISISPYTTKFKHFK